MSKREKRGEDRQRGEFQESLYRPSEEVSKRHLQEKMEERPRLGKKKKESKGGTSMNLEALMLGYKFTFT